MKTLKAFKAPRLLKYKVYLVLFIFLEILQIGIAFAGVKIAVLDSGSSIKVDKAVSFSSLPADYDPISHGTKIARVIKDQDPQAEVFMVQICEHKNNSFGPDIKAVKKGIQWARAEGVNLINLSLNLEYNQELASLIEEAQRKDGIIFIAAAGNKSFQEKFAVQDGYLCLKNKDQYSALEFPANLNSVISVGALDEAGKVAGYSASGADIYVDGNYGKDHGTSFAAAKVTGKISRILSQDKNLTLQQLKSILR